MRKYVWMFLIIGLLGSVIMMLTGNFFTIIGYFIIYFIITFALLGYSGFTIAAVHGVLFIMLYKDIKINKYGLIFQRLPNLEILEKLNFYSVVIGFILLSISIIIGLIWLPSAFPQIGYLDPKLISAYVIWIVFGSGILTKLLAKLYGKKVIIFSLIGFCIIILSLVVQNVFAESFHSFY